MPSPGTSYNRPGGWDTKPSQLTSSCIHLLATWPGKEADLKLAAGLFGLVLAVSVPSLKDLQPSKHTLTTLLAGITPLLRSLRPLKASASCCQSTVGVVRMQLQHPGVQGVWDSIAHCWAAPAGQAASCHLPAARPRRRGNTDAGTARPAMGSARCIGCTTQRLAGAL